MNILFISTMNGFPWGGSEELWFRTAIKAKSEGHTINIIVFRNEPLSSKFIQLQKLGIIINFIDKEEIIPITVFKKIYYKIRRKNYEVKYINRYSIIRRINPQIILLSQGGASDVTYYRDLNNFLQNTDIPFFNLIQHNVEYSIFSTEQRIILNIIVSKAKLNIFVSKRNKEVLERQLAIKILNFKKIDNPSNLKTLDILTWPNLNLPSFACVARLDVNFKGQHILFETLSLPKWAGRNYILNLYGEGQDKDYLHNLIEHYNLKHKVFLKGHVNNISEIWDNNHVLILPSISEGTPLSLQEAMVSGRPALVTDVGDNSSLIQDHKNGWVASNASVASLNKALEDCWDMQNSWELMGLSAHKFIKKYLDPNPEVKLLEYLTNAC